MMNEFIKMLLSLSISGTLLMLITFLFKQFYKNKFSRCWQYYIWIVVAIRFLVPFTTDSTITGYLFSTVDTSISYSNDIMDTVKNTDYIYQIDEKTDDTVTLNNNSQRNSTDIYTYMFFIWTVFTLVFIIRKVTIYQSFIQYIKAGNTEVSDIETLNLLADCEEKLNIRKTVELYCNPLIASPIMIGFINPSIVIPSREMKKENLYYIFNHELIHYKRHDILYKWFIQLVICVHWFNPFVYILGKEVNKACELSCDEAVISSLDSNKKRLYGDILISSVKTENAYKSSLASVTLTEGAEQLKERLGAIMSFRKKTKITTAITTIITMLICICFNTIGAYAKPDDNSKYTENQSQKEESYNQITWRSYTQQGFYQNSFIIEMGWNFSSKISSNPKLYQQYYSSAELTLEDNSKMTTYFSYAAKDYLNDSKALEAIGDIIYSLKNTKETYPKIEEPYIVNITPLQPSEIPTAAEEYFKNDDFIKFSAIFKHLEKTIQEEYFQKMYDSDKIAMFSIVIDYMSEDLILMYADKAEQDNKIDFFSIILSYMPSESLNKYAEQFYQKGDIAGFAVTISYMTDEEKQNWLDRARKDGKNLFYIILSDEVNDWKYK